MARALDLAWRGWGRVHPNPLVGAVVLAGGEVVGEGYHAEFGGAHAEPQALAAAGERARGATLVVTLEPCAHTGRQPPCTAAILAAGVRRVVVAMSDPNPVAAGGAALLRAAGVDVEAGILHAEAAVQNAAFLHLFRRPERPYVAVKLAASLDGRLADAGGRSKWISGPEARDWVQWLRGGFDAIAVGGRTAVADDPSLTVRGPLQPRVSPRRIVFDRSLSLSPDAQLVRSAAEVPVIVVAAPDAASGARADELRAAGVTVLAAASLAPALRELRSVGITSVLVEGGGRLAGALLAEGLVDRLYWVQSPLFLGERGAPAFAGLPSSPLDESARWQIVERRALGADTLLVVDHPSCLPAS
jgi:diaminohydroxyphosphoribosylaminopyrimidine deaminase/5-amino-6-(5-phosphoribosylamino)uracil reductase